MGREDKRGKKKFFFPLFILLVEALIFWAQRYATLFFFQREGRYGGAEMREVLSSMGVGV